MVLLLARNHHKRTETKRVTLSIIPCIDSSLFAFAAAVEFMDAMLSGLDSGSDSSTDGFRDRLDGSAGGSVGGKLAGASAGSDAAGAFSVETLLLTKHARQKSFPLEPI